MKSFLRLFRTESFCDWLFELCVVNGWSCSSVDAQSNTCGAHSAFPVYDYSNFDINDPLSQTRLNEIPKLDFDIKK